jgi:hypothetical protein
VEERDNRDSLDDCEARHRRFIAAVMASEVAMAMAMVMATLSQTMAIPR